MTQKRHSYLQSSGSRGALWQVILPPSRGALAGAKRWQARDLRLNTQAVDGLRVGPGPGPGRTRPRQLPVPATKKLEVGSLCLSSYSALAVPKAARKGASAALAPPPPSSRLSEETFGTLSGISAPPWGRSIIGSRQDRPRGPLFCRSPAGPEETISSNPQRVPAPCRADDHEDNADRESQHEEAAGREAGCGVL
jgi:hypothetical protein